METKKLIISHNTTTNKIKVIGFNGELERDPLVIVNSFNKYVTEIDPNFLAKITDPGISYTSFKSILIKRYF